jgi:prevent-host-death family protein
VKTATITQAKNQFSALVDRVRHGETIVITDRGRPVARLVSALTEAAADPQGRLARLERRGGLRRGAAPPPKALIMRKLPNAGRPSRASRTPHDSSPASSGVLAALLEERRDGR